VKSAPVDRSARTPTTHMMNTTRLADPRTKAAVTAMATSPKATNRTVGAEPETLTTMTATVETSHVTTADAAMTVTRTDTTTCSTASRVATLATTTEIGIGAVDTTTMTATMTAVEVVETLASQESLGSLSGRGRLWACSRTMRCPSSRRRVPNMCKNKWLMALGGASGLYLT